MKRFTAAIVAAAVITIGVCSPATAQVAPVPVIDASSLLKEASMIQNQINQLKTQAQQLQAEERSIMRLPQTIWSPVQQNVQQLQDILRQEGSLALTNANAATQFANVYAQYGYVPSQNFADEYVQWYRATMNASTNVVQAASGAIGQQAADLNALTAAEGQVGSAQGETAVLQASATISAQQVEQLHKLIALEAAEHLAEASERAAVASQAALRNASTQGMSFFVRGQVPTGYSTPAPAPTP